MLEDYESGIRRTPTRHTLGRTRWILLASIAVNFFLIYKYWTYSTEIVILHQNNQKLDLDLMTEKKQIEYYKKQTMMTDERRANCEKRINEFDSKSSECLLRHKDCSESLESTSAKLIELNQNLKTITQENEELKSKLETKLSEMESMQEEIKKLETEPKPNLPVMTSQVQNIQLEYTGQEKGDKTQEEKPAIQEETAGDAQNINSIDTPAQNAVNVKDSEEKRDVKEEGALVDQPKTENVENSAFIECDFSEESQDKGRCNYMKEPVDPHWEFGRPAFLQEHSTQCLYIDDSEAESGQKLSVVFQTFNTEKCLQMAINVTIVGDGQLSVQDNDKIHEVTMKNSDSKTPIWELQKFNFNAAPSHKFEISGSVDKVGGVALTRVTVTEGECEPDIKEEIDFENEEEEDRKADKEMVDDLV